MVFEPVQGLLLLFILIGTLILMSAVGARVEAKQIGSDLNSVFFQYLRNLYVELTENKTQRIYVHIILFLGLILCSIPVHSEGESLALFFLCVIWLITLNMTSHDNDIINKEKTNFFFMISMNFVFGSSLLITSDSWSQICGSIICLTSLAILNATELNVASWKDKQQIRKHYLAHNISLVWVFINLTKNIFNTFAIEYIYLMSAVAVVVYHALFNSLAAPTIEKRLMHKNSELILKAITVIAFVTLLLQGRGLIYG